MIPVKSLPSAHSNHSVAKPATYYDQGPFNAPSSDSEEEDELLERKGPSTPGIAEVGNFNAPYTQSLRQKRASNIRFLVTTLIVLVALCGIIGIIAAQTYVGTVYRLPGNRKITMDHIFNGTFAAERSFISWVPEGTPIVSYCLYSWRWCISEFTQDGFIKLVDLKTNTTSKLVKKDDVKDEHGKPLQHWAIWQLLPDMKYLLVKGDHQKQWMWSSFGNYYIHDIEAKVTRPMIPPANPPTTAYATWSPTGSSLAYVDNNDLYILTSPSLSTAPIRVTTYGNASFFHGVPDWVYEEEVFSSDHALWWSPDAQKVAFLHFDETAVDEFSFPIYNPTENNSAIIPYTSEITMNVVVNGFPAANAALELDWPGRHSISNSIIMEVACVDDTQILLKENIFPLPKSMKGSRSAAYLDIVPTPEGYNHIALYSPANSNTPRFLTSGEWEVSSGIKGVDAKLGLVSPDTVPPMQLTKTTPDETAYYETNFSPEAGFYLHSYEGPNIGWQKVIQTTNTDFHFVLHTNNELSNKSSQFETPTILYSAPKSEGFVLNVREVRPPRMDDSARTKYAVLFLCTFAISILIH
ncbi:dipeptidyl peptidase IV N-terminal region-domain-containing protein [Lentinula lateritia]|uniref:Dipeptidyl peptidase IV N-terminal region-domain-containing protein n=1 Tax=Lentinula lateritia TaxID=40482 RepID=A0ABQ8VIM5_9AGAR|nr:dipeptidyl peptidase IV N-terminal region-domain-containing protein [Lentinula lateritia]